MVTIYNILNEEGKVVKFGYDGILSSSRDKIYKKVPEDETVQFKSITEEEYKEQFKEVRKARVIKKVAIGTVGAVALSLAAKTLYDKFSVEKEKPAVVEEDINSMTIEELIAKLETEQERQAFTKMDAAQKQFNEVAGPSIRITEDKNAQLYLTGDEIIALYAYGNADTYTNETLGRILGKDFLDLEDLSKNHVQAARVLNTYYRYGTEPTGISNLFEDEENEKMFEEVENLILQYNKTKDSTVKSEIQKKLIEIYMSGQIDDLKTVNKEAASYIATFMVPTLYERGIIGEDQYRSITNINETITCNDLEGELEGALDFATESNKYKSKIVEIWNKLVSKRSRNINIEARESKKLYNSNSSSNNKGTQPTTSTTIVSTTRTEISKEEALSKFSKEEVSAAESIAESKFHEEYDDKNERQQEYAKGLSDGYAITYEKTFDAYVEENKTLTAANFSTELTNKINNYKGKYLDEYKKGLTEGAATGISQGIKDAQQAKKDMEEFWQANNTTEVDVSEDRYYGNEVPQSSTTGQSSTAAQSTTPPPPSSTTPPPSTTAQSSTLVPTTNVIVTNDFIIIEEIEEERVTGDIGPEDISAQARTRK